MSDLVSIVIPNYNYAQYIGACIQSVLDQTYEDFEVLVVDDGSTDQSLEIARGFTDPRVKVLPKPNGGVSSAKNMGIQAATGRWVGFLDSDDLWTRESLQLRVEAAAGAPKDDRPVFVCGQSLRVPRRTQLTDLPELAKQPPNGRRFNGSTILTEKRLFERFGLFREDIRLREDKEMWYRLVGKTYFSIHPRDPVHLETDKINLVWVEQLCAFYRQHNRSATYRFTHLRKSEQEAINELVNGDGTKTKSPLGTVKS